MFRSLKWKLQRLFRGYSEADTWQPCSFTVEKLQPVIKAYATYEAEKGHSLPNEFAQDPSSWLVIIKDIEYAFDWLYADEFGEPFHSDNTDAIKAHYDRVDRGCENFGKYFRHMWN